MTDCALTVCQHVSDSMAEYTSNGCQIPCIYNMKESISEQMYAICESQFNLISHHLRIKIDSSKDTRARYVPSRCQWLSVPKSSPTGYPRYLSQGPTANFILVLVETGGGIDLKNHPQLAQKKRKSLSLFFNSIAERSNVLFHWFCCFWMIQIAFGMIIVQ